MPKVEFRPATPGGRAPHTMLAQRLDGMAANLGRLAEDRVVLPPDEVAELHRRIRDAARDVREIGETKPTQPKRNQDVQDAYRLLMRAETQAGIIREALGERFEESDIDPNGFFSRKLAELRAIVEQADAVVAGRGKTQA